MSMELRPAMFMLYLQDRKRQQWKEVREEKTGLQGLLENADDLIEILARRYIHSFIHRQPLICG